MPRQRKTLPEDFRDLLGTGDLAALKAVFGSCELDARGGYSKGTALAFPQCPDDLARWLVAEGLDVDAADSYGCTPLRERAGYRGSIGVLIELGADVNAPDKNGATPLHAAAEAARILLGAGATVPQNARELVERIGHRFEFYRVSFNRDTLQEAEQALFALYELFGVTPVARRRFHDGTSPITVTAAGLQAQFDELWQFLVPGSGAAATVQGEVIRLTGKLNHEILDNGSANWDKDFRTMADALTTHLGTGTQVTDSGELDTLRRGVRAGDDDGTLLGRLSELAVAWVLANPDPVPLPAPPYAR